jgi:hypothetical protein
MYSRLHERRQGVSPGRISHETETAASVDALERSTTIPQGARECETVKSLRKTSEIAKHAHRGKAASVAGGAATQVDVGGALDAASGALDKVEQTKTVWSRSAG